MKIAATAGMAILHGWGVEMRQLMAGNVSPVDYRQLWSRIVPVDAARASASRSFTVEQQVGMGFDGPFIQCMTPEQRVAYQQWCLQCMQVVSIKSWMRVCYKIVFTVCTVGSYRSFVLFFYRILFSAR